MRQLVPRCAECEQLQCTTHNFASFSCAHTNKDLGVDTPPKTSPQWCPKREQKPTQ